MVKCKQCDFEHISNLYRKDEHTFTNIFLIMKAVPTVDMCPNVIRWIIILSQT